MINKIRSNRNNSYSGQNGKFFSLDKVSVKDKEIARNFIYHYLSTRECGITTYSQDLILALKNKFKNTLMLKLQL
jgi:hypothetical protein